MMRSIAHVVMVLGFLAGTGLVPRDAAASPALPSRSAHSPGAFPDNPLLASVPDDTPYVLATFKPFPVDYLHKLYQLFEPTWRKLSSEASGSPAFAAGMRAAEQELGDLSAARLEKIGISPRARFVVYGLGAYPVWRVELLDGSRLLGFVDRVVARLGMKLPPGIQRSGRTYWLIPVPSHPSWTLLMAVGPKELVMAAAPRATIDGNLPLLIGEQPAAHPLTTAALRAIAARDGFTGQGVGYVDVTRVSALAADAFGLPGDCRSALAGTAARAPRIGFGYDDLSGKRLAFGMVIETAPDLTTELRGLQGTLAGFDHLLESSPMFAFEVAGSLDGARALAPRLGAWLRDLGQRCDADGLVRAAGRVDSFASAQLPPFASGIHGLVLAFDRLETGQPFAAPKIEGWAVADVDHADDLVSTVLMLMPGLQLATDGKAYPLPATVPFPGHVAASHSAIALALGPHSATKAVAALRGRPVPAPLAVLEVDYSRMGELLAASGGSDPDATAAMVKAFGRAWVQVLADERGLVVWNSFELR